MTVPLSPRFLDTNVFLRLLTRDDEAKADHALALLTRVERGEERVITSSLVIFEVVFTLRKSYAVSPEGIRDRLLPLITLRGLELDHRNTHVRALRLFSSAPLSYADAYNVAYMESMGATEIYSWDADFDRLERITRIEPM